MPPDSISEHQFSLRGHAPRPPSMQCTFQLHTMLTTLTQNLPDQSKFASYTPVVAFGWVKYWQWSQSFILL